VVTGCRTLVEGTEVGSDTADVGGALPVVATVSALDVVEV
jgi:hypothetical protein